MEKSLKPLLIILALLLFATLAVWGLGDALTPLLISFVLAYLLFPLIRKLEEKGFQRTYAVSTVFALLFLTLVLILILVIPGLVTDIRSFLTELPVNSAKAFKKIELLAAQFGYQLDLSRDSMAGYIKSHISNVSGSLVKSVGIGIKSSFTGVTHWLLAILNLFLIPLFFFYVVNDFEKISEEIKSFVPKSIRPKLRHYFELSNNVLSGYIRGQFLVAVVLGLLYATGLTLVGLRFGFLIGLLSGLISIIPYAGFTLGFLAAIIMSLANYSGPSPLLGIAVVFLIVQTLEGILITPKLVGDKVGLSSLATMLALIIGGNLLGLVGMLAAIPLAAIGKVLIADLKKEYQELDLYKNET